MTKASSQPLLAKLMVIGAHAGDVENMAGAVILKHTRAGCQAAAVHVSLGEAGHPTLPPEEYIEQRKAEALKSAAIMGCEVTWLKYADGMVPVDEAIKLEVCDLIRAQKPDVILTHWKGSFHKDHAAVHDVVKDAIFYAALPAVKRKDPAHRISAVYYPENWEDMDGWRADLYLDTSAVWKEYLEALRCHEFIRTGASFRYLDYYDALGTLRGCLGRFEKAAALMLPNGSWVRKCAYLPGFEP